jgi:aminoglycoside phosphotransferase (APT) family kinase protein
MRYGELNRANVVGDTRYAEAWRMLLPHLGDYVAVVVRALNLRPQVVSLLAETSEYVLLRIKLPSDQVVLKLAPGGDLSGEAFFCRALAGKPLPTPRLIHQDLTCGLVPCPYLVSSYHGGVGADALTATHEQRALGRQLGRALRQIHRVDAPAFGNPGTRGRWQNHSWPATLALLHASSGAAVFTPLLFSEQEWAALRAATLDHPALAISAPRLIHGGLRLDRLRCTLGDATVRLEVVVDPGPVVGGDPLLDLACALVPMHPEPFRTGLREGYGTLLPGDERRLARLRVLTSLWDACRHYAAGHDCDLARQATLVLLGELGEDQ